MKYEYVASACCFLKLSETNYATENSKKALNQVISNTQNKDDLHQMSFLFNAFVEPIVGKFLNDNIRESARIHADSGGLQITTTGAEANEENKREIYEIQSKYADVSMCFDEIPVTKTIEGSAQSIDVSTKLFHADKIAESGIETGININNQLRYFAENNSKSKVYLIVQGNSFDTRNTFTEEAYSQIDEELRPLISGLAMATTCSGHGVKEQVTLCANIPHLPVPTELKKNIHLLGVGSLQRLMPTVILKQTGYLSCVEHISYDSTSHTRTLDYGVMKLATEKSYKFSRNSPKELNKALERVYSVNSDVIENFVDKQTYFDYMTKYLNKPTKLWNQNIKSSKTDKIPSEISDCLRLSNFLFFNTVYEDFTDRLTILNKDVIELENYICKSRDKDLRSLLQVSNIHEYTNWERKYSNRLSSSPVPHTYGEPENTLF